MLAQLSAAGAESMGLAASATPVQGATVQLYLGARQVGEATTGVGGYFRFDSPAGGNCEVEVIPPPGMRLQQARRQFMHQHRQQTVLTIVLEPVAP